MMDTVRSMKNLPTRPGNRMGARPNYTPRYMLTTPVASESPVVLRREIGEVLRLVRQRQGRTLREVSSAAQVSLGYLSEVERGQKEASSELLASISGALNVPMSTLLRMVADRVAHLEGVSVPDTIPDSLLAL